MFILMNEVGMSFQVSIAACSADRAPAADRLSEFGIGSRLVFIVNCTGIWRVSQRMPTTRATSWPGIGESAKPVRSKVSRLPPALTGAALARSIQAQRASEAIFFVILFSLRD